MLFDHCNKFGVCFVRASGYTSGPSRHWVKVKCPDWNRDNTDR